MATKSKNIKYGKGVKTAALLIALVMFFSSGYFANLFIRGFADYNAYDTSNGLLYTQTTAFRDLMNHAEDYLISNAMFEEPMTFEEYKASQAGKAVASEYDNLAKEVSDAYDLLESSGIEVYVSNDNSYYYLLPYKTLVYAMNGTGEYVHEDHFFYSYYNTGAIEKINSDSKTIESTTPVQTQPVTQSAVVELTNENGESYTTAVATTEELKKPEKDSYLYQGGNGIMFVDENGKHYRFYIPDSGSRPPLEVQDVADALATINRITHYTSYGESTKERLIAEIANGDKEGYLYQNWQNSISYNHYSYIVNNIKSVNYAIIRENGKVITNCGVLVTDTQEQILEKLGGEFVEASIKGEYKLLKGEKPADTESAWGGLAEMLFGERVAIMSAGSSLFTDPKNSSAYFSYVQRSDIVDPFTISFNAFTDFTQSSVNNLTTLLILFGISLLIACAACIYLLCVAGKTADGIRINFFDRIPAEINWILGIGIMALLGVGVVFITFYEASPIELAFHRILNNEFINVLLNAVSLNTDLITGLAAALFFVIWTELNASFIRNIRNKSFWKHTLIYQLFRLAGWLLKNIWKFLVFILKPFEKIFKKIGTFFKKQIDKVKYIFACDYSKGQGTKFKIVSLVLTAAVLLLLLLMGMWAGLATDWGSADFTLILFIVLIVFTAVGLFAMLIFVSLDRIMACVSQAREGNLNGKIDTKFMPPFMCRFAEDILSMQDGLQNAVESAVKDQRMKAELITNVSHDLKTPLTSIVNYVDLLKKCEVEDETAQRYITVLDEKAARMKKLIEDLVEASKASSGAIEIHPVKVNLCEFAAQAVGEHEDELQKFSIGLVLKAPPSPVTVTADSQKTSRIVENLFSNIRKYAMEGTRVYVEVIDGSAYGSIVFKNISKYPLDVSADELTQRFVRGDASRSGDGSGLGLSIAQNLCELQKGRFKVEVDGDLFKVTLSLPKTE